VRWDEPLPALGMFDAIVASDVLYERGHAELIAGLVERHALPDAEVLVTDPGRGNSARFSRLLAEQGFTMESERCPMKDDDLAPYRGRILHFRRGARLGKAAAT
jgi:predicted nicotinamide N-methyase